MASLTGAPQPSSLAPHLSPSSTSSSTTLAPQARRTFQESFDRFEKTVQKRSKNDQRDFNDTTLRDVQEAAKEIEQQLAARQCLRNLKRLEPLLSGLEAYSKVVEVLCNGTPYVPWIWAPIKLMMKLATDNISAFEKLISAYAQIAENLPRFDRLSNAFRNNPDFQQVLAVVYSDILEFHRQAYKFFRRSGWKCFFKSSWGQFEAKFNCILESMSRHAKLVDQEANAFLISETMQWRKDAREAANRAEKDRRVVQLTASLAWLGVENVPHCGQSYQDNSLNTLTNDCCPGTTDWIMKHQKMQAWLQDGRGSSTLWLKGKPGSGKSTICARIAQSLRTYSTHRRYTLLYCFYGYRISTFHPDPVIFILATLASQILRQNIKLSAYIYEEFVAEARSPSIRELQQILSDLMPQLKMPRILIDGIDECVHYDCNGRPRDLNPVKGVLQAILQLEHPVNGMPPPKILLVSRDVSQVTVKLSKKPTVSLDDENDAITIAIRYFTKQRFREIQDRFESFPDVDNILNKTEDMIISRSQGMFLWVKLVLSHLEEDAYNLNDLEAAVANMPVSLNSFYDRILARVMLLSPSSRERANSMLNWMICGRRPLRSVELQDAIAFATGQDTLTERSKLPKTILDLCKPLIQTHSDGHVSFVHFTVQEFLLGRTSTSSLESERCVSMSCLKYLNFSLGLIRQYAVYDSRTVDVGKCLYTLQSYAKEHWLDHLLAFISKLHGVADKQLEERLDRLVDIIQSHQTQASNASLNFISEGPESALSLEPRLEHIRHSGYIYEALCKVVRHRHQQMVHFKNPALAHLHPDPTPFSIVQAEHQKRVEVLLSSTSFPGLTPAQLAIFHDYHRPFAFVCRFPGCSSILAGFATHDERGQHEKSHAPPLVCTHSGCKYTLGFSSLQLLKRHIREFHNAALAGIPRSLRPQKARSLSKDAPDSYTKGSTQLDKSDYNTTSSMKKNAPHEERATEQYFDQKLLQGYLEAQPWYTPPLSETVHEREVRIQTTDLREPLLRLFKQLRTNPDAWPFGTAEIAGGDISIQEMERKLDKNLYPTLEGFVHDAQSMFNHCRSYYIPDKSVKVIQRAAESADRLEEFMWKQIREMKIHRSFDPSQVKMNERFWRSRTSSYNPGNGDLSGGSISLRELEYEHMESTPGNIHHATAHNPDTTGTSFDTISSIPMPLPRAFLSSSSAQSSGSTANTSPPPTKSTNSRVALHHFVQYYRVQLQKGQILSGWRLTTSPEERGTFAYKFFIQCSSIIIEIPDMEATRLALQFERANFTRAQTREQYVQLTQQGLRSMAQRIQNTDTSKANSATTSGEINAPQRDEVPAPFVSPGQVLLNYASEGVPIDFGRSGPSTVEHLKGIESPAPSPTSDYGDPGAPRPISLSPRPPPNFLPSESSMHFKKLEAVGYESLETSTARLARERADADERRNQQLSMLRTPSQEVTKPTGLGSPFRLRSMGPWI
ncbi:uncharacterized protein K460DRAFT_404584 [Cucurbitaria berberidis CBS 394.84]|uniref:NACHT domain-containing protein n=1 Tax=Cucurbitaria berberidis CBS 394.84 TaxID=1168544 RepID=A0A9P4GQE0_9PLEO|nr:uncharacterized protein K460DRAFT_404584 [Cucurbitaria berberidis CBS 394.84]KAF1849355.1 hypothetical protein K460DRAFT_404584 [Cucurbitaria berberidis CBS 394.84]